MRIQLKHFELNIRIWLIPLAAVVLYVLASLGNWQVSRAEWKEQYLKEFELRNSQNLPIQELLELDESLQGYKTTVTGTFNNDRNFLLDNQLYQKRAGYHVLTPLTTEDGITLLVNRGWIFRGKHRSVLPDIPPVEGTVSVRGVIHIPSDRQIVLSDEQEKGEKMWPARIQKVDFDYMSGLFGVQLAPLTVRVEPDFELETNEQFVREWIQVSVPPEKHLAYALQWYGMAIAFALLFIALTVKRSNRDDQAETPSASFSAPDQSVMKDETDKPNDH